MIIRDYIKQKFQTFGIQLSEADLLDITMNAEDEVTEENKDLVNFKIVKFIPTLILRATSISESGFSMSWDTQGLKDYYSMRCKEYGIEDLLSDKPKVAFL